MQHIRCGWRCRELLLKNVFTCLSGRNMVDNADKVCLSDSHKQQAATIAFTTAHPKHLRCIVNAAAAEIRKLIPASTLEWEELCFTELSGFRTLQPQVNVGDGKRMTPSKISENVHDRWGTKLQTQTYLRMRKQGSVIQFKDALLLFTGRLSQCRNCNASV